MMSLLHRTQLRFGLRAASAALLRAPRPTPAPQTPASTTLNSSHHLWEGATQTFYAEFAHYTECTSDVVRMLQAAELAMHRCLAERRAEEALEVYATLCRCGVAGSAADSSTHTHSSANSLERLAREAVQLLPHRTCQHSVLMQVMAAELDTVSLPTSLLYPAKGHDAEPATRVSVSRVNESSSTRSAGMAAPPHLIGDGTMSAAEQTRIRIRQRLHTLHATGQLPQQLGKEYCLVEMQEVGAAPARSSVSARSNVTRLREEVEMGPLCTLAQCVLTHPFTYATPSAPWAQRELLWETDAPTSARWSSAAALSGAHSHADAARLLQIDHVVRPYRQLCRTSLDFLAACVPDWDALFLRRAAETLILPPAAHVVFPTEYHRTRRTSATTHEPSCSATASTTWTDAVLHQLFSHPAATPLARVEAIVRRRVQHDVVVPDTAYVVHHFHQLRQLARHREVVLTHAVVVELVAAAARTDNPLRFHIRRVLREVMQATTTAVTAVAAQRELLVKERGGRGRSRSNHGGAMGFATQRRSSQAHGGYTLLGLQDELALLDGCPERFFLQDGNEDGAFGPLGSGQANTWSSVSVVLVAKQLERMIAAHDRGADFASPSRVDSGRGSSTSASLDVDGLVSHLLGSKEDAAACGRAEPLFKSRSRGRWARLPTLVATTSDATRAAAFQVGLQMHPPAGVAL